MVDTSARGWLWGVCNNNFLCELRGTRGWAENWRTDIKLERFLEYIIEISRESVLCSENSNLIS